MSLKHLIAVAALGAPLLVGAALPSAAQNPAPPPTRRVVHPHIEINPRPLLYRRCAAWYVLQNRPSGTVLFPQQHCWWVRG